MIEENLSTSHMSKYLRNTFFMNYSHPLIQQTLSKILPEPSKYSQIEKIQRMFNFVRDIISYRVTHEISTPKFLQASNTLKRGYGHCVAKAILLASFTRACGIPTRLHFVDLINHQLSERWIEKFGEELLWHGYVEIYLNNHWIALNPAYDKKLCEKHGYRLVEFDGVHDALFAKTDKMGRSFIDYVADHGVFARVPYFKMGKAWFSYYGPYFWQHRKQRAAKSTN
ncbi:MAG: transglutaminase-like domain-containing protein [Promethearchaeota archaeon]